MKSIVVITIAYRNLGGIVPEVLLESKDFIVDDLEELRKCQSEFVDEVGGYQVEVVQAIAYILNSAKIKEALDG